MMKVNFALFRLFERIVPIRRALFRNVHATDEILGDSDSKSWSLLGSSLTGIP